MKSIDKEGFQNKKMQTNLDMFIQKKKKQVPQKANQKDHHDSSRQNSETEPLESKQEKNQRAPIQYNKKLLACIPFYLSCPSDSIHFEKIENNLKELKKNYNPTKKNLFYKYIEKNLSFHDKRFNAQNLKLIEDENFWKETLPKMISYFLDNHKQIRCVSTLSFTKKNSKVVVTRGQALTILISLFFGIMPKNPLTKTRSFGQFTTKISGGQKNAEIRLQKLKFLINYFNKAVEKIQNKDGESNFEYETITFQKHVSNTIEIRNDLNPEKTNGRDPPLMDLEFSEDKQLKIEDYYGHAAMLDFANSSIGGGALRKGCVQEEILFLIFPEAYVSMFLVPEMKDNEAIAIYGLRKYSKYKNYSYNLNFDGAQDNDELKNVNSSVIIAIDATNFSNNSKDYQFSKQNTLREIAKAITGFNTISESGFDELGDLNICTGRWGCGAFEGDQIWKFFIQWIACSYTYRNMIYISDQQQVLSQIRTTVQKLVQKGKTVLGLYAMMEEFMKLKRRFSKPPQDYTFIDYIKSQYVL